MISVLMTVYNNESYIEKAIRSVLAQTYSDFEFVIIDDGSMDRSVEMIRSFRDSRIRFYQNDKNIGQSPSLNKGLAFTRRPFVARMDADDIALPKRLEKQIAFALEKEPVFGAIGTQIQFIDADNKILFSPKMPLE